MLFESQCAISSY